MGWVGSGRGDRVMRSSASGAQRQYVLSSSIQGGLRRLAAGQPGGFLEGG